MYTPSQQIDMPFVPKVYEVMVQQENGNVMMTVTEEEENINFSIAGEIISYISKDYSSTLVNYHAGELSGVVIVCFDPDEYEKTCKRTDYRLPIINSSSMFFNVVKSGVMLDVEQ